MPQKITPGRIVTYFPPTDKPLPNNMTSAPAMVVQTWDQEEPVNINLVVFVADPNSPNTSFNAWSVPHKGDAPEGTAYWDWPQKS